MVATGEHVHLAEQAALCQQCGGGVKLFPFWGPLEPGARAVRAARVSAESGAAGALLGRGDEAACVGGWVME